MDENKLEALRNRRAALVRKRKSATNQKDINEINKSLKNIDNLINFWSKNG